MSVSLDGLKLYIGFPFVQIIPGKKAEGSVTITRNGNTEELTISMGQKLKARSLIFVSLEDLIIPVDSNEVILRVQASASGSVYNIPSNSPFSLIAPHPQVPSLTTVVRGISIVNPKSFSGGDDRVEQKVNESSMIEGNLNIPADSVLQSHLDLAKNIVSNMLSLDEDTDFPDVPEIDTGIYFLAYAYLDTRCVQSKTTSLIPDPMYEEQKESQYTADLIPAVMRQVHGMIAKHVNVESFMPEIEATA